VLPNIFTPMIAYATIDIGSVVIIYAGLSYLGLSIRPPLPEWGAMVSAYQDYLVSAPWLPIFPALVIGIVVVAFSILGDGLRDAVEAARIG
jgi:ABC-type dipeptide/oligopeptide/nickel transport system permease subunit